MCRFVSHDVAASRHTVSLKSADDVDICSLLSIRTGAVDSVNAMQIAPRIISPGKHKVIHNTHTHTPF